MEAGGSMVVVGGNLTFIFELEDTELVNQSVEDVVYWIKLPLLGVTLVLNIAAAVVIRQKEDIPINRLIIWDCLINVMTAIIQNGERHKLSNAYMCSIWMFSILTLSTWNRLVPVGIAVFRYVLVCAMLCAYVICCSGLLSHFHPNPGSGLYLEDGLRVRHPSQPRHWRSELVGSRGDQAVPAVHGQGGNIQVRAVIRLDD
jgi:hypothetical protein